jgi:hypothetical protein
MPNFKRQKHGIRVNLSNLNKAIKELEQDRTELIRHGYKTEALGVEKKLRDMYTMHADAVRHGYGYYDVSVTHRGRTLMLCVVGALVLTLAVMYLLTLFN